MTRIINACIHNPTKQTQGIMNMGIYVYKVIGKSVKLTNGEVANISLFAYKSSWNNDDGVHGRSGASRCDTEAERGNRSGWIVRGYKEEDGSIMINPVAQKACKPIGSFTETFKTTGEECTVVSKLPKNISFFKERSK